MVTGILLPNSTTHPTLPHDFTAGLKGALKNVNGEIKLAFGYIGFGSNKEAVKIEAEKLILEQDAEVIVAFADHPVVNVLFPLVKTLNKLLIVVNNGAKYPDLNAYESNVIFHTLNNSYCSFLTSKSAAENTSRAAVASSYFDGGYSLCHAITEPYMKAGKEIIHNFAGSYKTEDFNTSSLTNVLLQDADPAIIFTVLSGNLVPAFLNQLGAAMGDKPVRLYASPVMMEETIDTYHEEMPENCTVEGYTGWYSGAPQSENSLHIETVEKETGRKANAFTALGWDTGLIINELVLNSEDHKTGLSKDLFLPPIKGAKGALLFDTEYRQVCGDAYHMRFTKTHGAQLLKTITAETGRPVMKEMINQEIGAASGWLNTYMCS